MAATMDFERRCCNKGCTNVLHDPKTDGWYKLGWGFMCWACPEHAAIWRDFCARNRKWEREHGEAHNKAYDEWVEAFEASYAAENPIPVAPPSQQSV